MGNEDRVCGREGWIAVVTLANHHWREAAWRRPEGPDGGMITKKFEIWRSPASELTMG